MDKSFEPKNNAIIVALLIVALVLGVEVYNKKHKQPQTAKSQNVENQNSKQQQNPIVLSDPQYDKNLTELQKKLFYNPPLDAPQEEKDKYFMLAVNSATAGNTITVNECSATPDVLKVKFGDKITVKNTGSTDIKFGPDPDSKITIKAKQSAVVGQELFKHGPGLYGYGCENPGVKRAIGMVLLTP